MHRVAISSTGLFTPPEIITNEELVVAFNAYARLENEKHADAIAAGTRVALTDSNVEFIEKASGIKRRYVMEKQSGIWAKVQSQGAALLIIDADFFKKINDNYGHPAGDAALVEIARRIQLNVRDSDIVVRWGGEEFLLILPQTEHEKAFEVAEKIRATVESANFPIVKHKTISIGVTCYQNGDSIVQLIARADKALYEAKNTGRNKVVVNLA